MALFASTRFGRSAFDVSVSALSRGRRTFLGCDAHLTVRPAIRLSAPVTAGRALPENDPTSDVLCRLTGTVGFRSSGPTAALAAWARVASDLITRLDSPARPGPLRACTFQRLRFTIQDAFHRISLLRALAPQPSSFTRSAWLSIRVRLTHRFALGPADDRVSASRLRSG